MTASTLPRCAVFLLLASCMDGGAPAPRTDLLAREDFPEWSAREEARIGSLDDPRQGLTHVGPVLIGPAGEIVVGQPQEHAIDVFSAEGRYLRTIGREGEGPGELRSIDKMGFRGDTLHVGDDGLRRLSYFSLDGGFLHSVGWSGPTRMEEAGGVSTSYSPGTPELLLADGDGLVEVSTFQYVGVTPGQTTAPRFDPRTSIPFVRMAPSGEVTDTLGWRVEITHRLDVPRTDGRVFWFTVPFVAGAHGSLLRDGSGLATAYPDSSAVDPLLLVSLVGPAGDTVFTRRLAYEPIPVSDALLRREAERLVRDATAPETLSGPATVVSRLRGSGLLPAHLPPVSALATGQDGTIWIRREETESEEVLWQVLDREGSPAGSLSLPRSQRVVAATGDRVVALEHDELDVPFLILYALRR